MPFVVEANAICCGGQLCVEAIAFDVFSLLRQGQSLVSIRNFQREIIMLVRSRFFFWFVTVQFVCLFVCLFGFRRPIQSLD